MFRSIFNLENQNHNLDSKIVAGLERLSEVFRVLLWEKAKKYGLSPIQIQLLIFLKHHDEKMSKVSYLSREFNLTKPTISDAIKVLEQKRLIEKFTVPADSRSFTIKLTMEGMELTSDLESFADPIADALASVGQERKIQLWESLNELIYTLNKKGIIQIQRMCFTCAHYEKRHDNHYCKLINAPLPVNDIRLDCPEHEFQD